MTELEIQRCLSLAKEVDVQVDGKNAMYYHGCRSGNLMIVVQKATRDVVSLSLCLRSMLNGMLRTLCFSYLAMFFADFLIKLLLFVQPKILI